MSLYLPYEVIIPYADEDSILSLIYVHRQSHMAVLEYLCNTHQTLRAYKLPTYIPGSWMFMATMIPNGDDETVHYIQQVGTGLPPLGLAIHRKNGTFIRSMHTGGKYILPPFSRKGKAFVIN